MPASISDLIEKGCSIIQDSSLSNNQKEKLRIIGSHYSTLERFLNASIDDYNAFKTVEGEPCFKKLTNKEIETINEFKQQISPNESIEQNFISILTSDFINKQIRMLEALTVEKLNSNPMLCRALNFQTANDLVRYNAYAAISRSIVTSMGFLIQNLLLYSSENVYDGKDYKEGDKTKYDIVVESLNGVRSYIEVKSGPNDLDAAQIKHYKEEIEKVEKRGYKGFIGITYGKRGDGSVSINLFEQYLPKWNDRTLIGQELWDYVTNNPDYHDILMNKIQQVAESLLGMDSIVVKIEDRITQLTTEFEDKFATLEDYYSTLW
jgi:hypothetical protein